MRPAARPLSVFGTALALVCAPFAISAQSPCQPLQDLKNRCEGLRRQLNAAPDYELLGLFGAVPAVGDVYPSELKVSFFRPPNDSIQSFNVREIQHETFYEMRPKLEPLNAQPPGLEQFQGWSTAEIMRPSHVRVGNLAVLIRLHDPQIRDLFAPAFLYAGGEPESAKFYRIDLVVHKQMASFQCTLVNKDGEVVKPTQSSCRFNKTSYLSSEPVRVTIAASGLPEGLITAHISADYANDESHRLDLDVRFLHHKLPNETF